MCLGKGLLCGVVGGGGLGCGEAEEVSLFCVPLAFFAEFYEFGKVVVDDGFYGGGAVCGY